VNAVTNAFAVNDYLFMMTIFIKSNSSDI